jgi:hypothetical protein
MRQSQNYWWFTEEKTYNVPAHFIRRIFNKSNELESNQQTFWTRGQRANSKPHCAKCNALEHETSNFRLMNLWKKISEEENKGRGRQYNFNFEHILAKSFFSHKILVSNKWLSFINLNAASQRSSEYRWDWHRPPMAL